MKRLFNENKSLNADGLRLDVEISNVLRSIINTWMSAGYSVRDIENVVIIGTSIGASMTICEEILRNQIAKHKKFLEENK